MAVEALTMDQPLSRFTGKDPVDFRTKAEIMAETAKEYYSSLHVPDADASRIIGDQIKKARIARQRLKNPQVFPYKLFSDFDRDGHEPDEDYVREHALNTLIEFKSLMRRAEQFVAQKADPLRSGDLQANIPISLSEK
jgi:hypothetical protein